MVKYIVKSLDLVFFFLVMTQQLKSINQFNENLVLACLTVFTQFSGSFSYARKNIIENKIKLPLLGKTYSINSVAERNFRTAITVRKNVSKNKKKTKTTNIVVKSKEHSFHSECKKPRPTTNTFGSAVVSQVHYIT